VKAETLEGKNTMTIELKYYQDRPVIERLERVSRPGLRIFKRADQLPGVQGGLGVAIVSTSHGVMTNVQAKAQGHGGEVLCIVL
jgi:small subunit ribosomal protein S8